MDCTIYEVKTKALISCAFNAHLIRTFVFAYMQKAGFLMSWIIYCLFIYCRIFALILQFVVRKKTGILVKIGRVGFGTFYRVHVELKKGLHVVCIKAFPN